MNPSLVTDYTRAEFLFATVYGKVQDEGNSKVVKVGFVWAGVLNPTLQNNVASIAGFGIGAFSVKLERLENDSTYFIWPYLTNKEGTLS